MVRSVGTMALSRLGRCCRSLVRESSKGVFCGVSQPGGIEGCIGAKRYLLSEDVIKLQIFQKKKLAVAHLRPGAKGNFIELFRRKLQRNQLVLRDDLKLLLHLCQSADDMVLARDAIYRYHAENRNFREFKFGPLFIRLCYELDLVDLAVATVTDQKMEGFFCDSTSFNIVIDMLFTKGYYEKAVDILATMKKQGVPFSKDTMLLAFGSYYKLNTEESYKICTTLLEEKQALGYFIPRHAYCFAIALALRRNDVVKAQSLFSQIISTDSKLCQNLRVVITAMSGEVMDAISILSAAIMPKSLIFVKKPLFSEEVVDLLRLLTRDQPDMMHVEHVVSQLEQANQVTEQTLDDMLCCTPKARGMPVMDERKISRRTLKPLWSTLLSE